MTDTQPSRLLPKLFERVDPSRPLTVLILGPALPETVSFFSQFRCKLHVVDLARELFDDLLNYLSPEAIAALMANLRPHLHPDSLGHCLAPHTSRTPAGDTYFGIADAQSFRVRRIQPVRLEWDRNSART